MTTGEAVGWARRKDFAAKNFGDAHRVPMVALHCLTALSAFCCFSSLLSFWLPWIYSPFPLFMEFRNAILLQLVECIESTQNEVKRKMIDRGVRNAAPKSLHLARAENFARVWQLHPHFASSSRARVFIARFFPRMSPAASFTTNTLLWPRSRIFDCASPSIMYCGFADDESCEGAHLCRVQAML